MSLGEVNCQFMPLTAVLNRIMKGFDLSQEESRKMMSVFASGDASAEQIAGVLVALQIKGVRPAELAGLAEFMREKAIPLAHQFPVLVDTSGTGGGRTTFNLSTGAAIVAASVGAKVAKHGNRSVTSKCGSADVLEAFGVVLTADTERLCHLLDEVGIVFLFAPNHHGSLQGVGTVRRALGVRTVFNQLGPLANPAGARRQLIGVYDKELVRPMAEALALLGTERAFVVHSEDGMDEISPCAPTTYAEVLGSKVTDGRFIPADFGLHDVPDQALSSGESMADSARILRSALNYSEKDRSDALVPNASVAILLAGLTSEMAAGSQMAKDAMASGVAVDTLDKLVEASRL